MKIINKFLFIALSLICLSLAVKAQTATFKPLNLTQSNIINELKAVKAANPNLPAEEFLKTANALLEKQGINFTAALDAANCRKIKELLAGKKDKSAPSDLRFALKSPVGENANLLLPEISYPVTQCVPCFFRLPILEVRGNEFVTLVEGRSIKFYLPSNFILNEVFLVDEKNLTTVKTTWKVPFRAAPLSVSDDGNILYLGFPEPELSDLALMIYSAEGVYQFSLKSEIDASKKGAPLKDFPKDTANPSVNFIKFTSGETNQVIKFSANCEN